MTSDDDLLARGTTKRGAPHPSMPNIFEFKVSDAEMALLGNSSIPLVKTKRIPSVLNTSPK